MSYEWCLEQWLLVWDPVYFITSSTKVLLSLLKTTSRRVAELAELAEDTNSLTKYWKPVEAPAYADQSVHRNKELRDY